MDVGALLRICCGTRNRDYVVWKYFQNYQFSSSTTGLSLKPPLKEISDQSWNLVLFFENLKPKLKSGFIFWKSQTKVGLKVLFFGKSQLKNLNPKWSILGRLRRFLANLTQYRQISGRLRRFSTNFDAILPNFGPPAALFGPQNFRLRRFFCQVLIFWKSQTKVRSRFYFLKISNQSWSQGFIFWKSQTKVGPHGTSEGGF